MTTNHLPASCDSGLGLEFSDDAESIAVVQHVNISISISAVLASQTI